jgi:hypothetical protein
MREHSSIKVSNEPQFSDPLLGDGKHSSGANVGYFYLNNPISWACVAIGQISSGLIQGALKALGCGTCRCKSDFLWDRFGGPSGALFKLEEAENS